MKVLEKEGKKVILLGNEAVVRGALESGLSFVSTFPGTPASEIGDTFSQIAKQLGIYFEYSVNEKVALEAATGAALSGLKALVTFKNFGLNVASDSLFPLPYLGVKNLVVVVSDDVNCWSSAQSEQDTRLYSYMANIPMIEPSSPQECKDFTKIAFEISEKFETPVLLRLTTRVSHTRGIVKLGKIFEGKSEGFFKKDKERFFNLLPNILKMHEKVLEKMKKIKEFSEKSKANFIVNGKGDFGIITSGISFNYLMEAMSDLKVKFPVLKLSITNPLPEDRIKKFIKNLKKVLVIEELEPILEEKVKVIAKDCNPRIKVYGKNVLPGFGEFNEEIVISAIKKVTGIGLKLNHANLESYRKKYEEIKIPKRFPLMCPGCPHRSTFFATKKAIEEIGVEIPVGGDIGCYMLGVYPPLDVEDFLVSMGAGEGIVHGISKATKQRTIAFIGDSTFFHAGIPALINMVFNKSNPLIIILDNRYTSMTGHQPHPGTGFTGLMEETKAIEIENLVRACGVENVKVIDPFNVNEMVSTIKEFLEKEKVSVIVAKRECQLMAVRKKKKEGLKIPKFEIDQSKCNKCGICLKEFACPAIYEENNEYKINSEVCTGCAVCFQICPVKAIRVRE
ncbi:MAG: indolepyruvate ferredoxin oxidoreductase subunit alpha [Candidatus Aenigmatarchaeota archaeon]